jgi:hypothetical protein
MFLGLPDPHPDPLVTSTDLSRYADAEPECIVPLGDLQRDYCDC